MKEITLSQSKVAIVDDRDYDELSKVNWCASRIRNCYYAVRTSSRKDGKHNILMHRVIWEMHNGPIPKGFEIDHINGNGLDNRLENLRLCTSSQNHINQHTARPHSSNFKGVRYHTGTRKWAAAVTYERKRYYIGLFTSEIEAARAYDAKVKELCREYAKLNFPGE